MISLDKFKVTLVNASQDAGQFQIGPLPRGFGYTLGNAIRRMLLSSIPGAAVTAVKIAGAKHEYSTLQGVQDDVISILLKLKELSVKMHTDTPQIILLKASGKKGSALQITAENFQIPSEVEIFNPELEVTTLTNDVNFEAEITVEKGVGYAYPDEDKRKELGVMPIDSVFSPVRRVQVEVVEARFGEYTDLDQVNLVVNTNGSVTPQEAMLEAVKLLDLMANKLVDLLGGDSSLNEIPMEEDQGTSLQEEKILVSQLNLSTRLTNALLNAGVSDLRELKNYSREEVANFRGMGKKSMTELEDLMLEQEIKFDSDI